MNPMDRTLASGDWRPMPATFPMVLGADGAGVVEGVGEGATGFPVGQSVFGQLLVAPLGSAGTYAEYVAVSEDAPLAVVPDGLDFVGRVGASDGRDGRAVAGGLTRAAHRQDRVDRRGGGWCRHLCYSVRGERRGAGDSERPRFRWQYRMRSYGAAETVDPTVMTLADAVRKAHPDGIDVLLDLVSDGDGFATLAPLVRSGGTAVTTRYVADTAALESAWHHRDQLRPGGLQRSPPTASQTPS